MRAMPLLLMIDDKTTLVGILAGKPDKATFILYDGSLLREGVTFTSIMAWGALSGLTN
jgi:hypothetical protein